MSRDSLLAQQRPAEWLLAAALLAAMPASAVLPPAWSREGGLLENLQVLVLCAACLYALGCYLRTRGQRAALLALWSAPVWLLLAARELSWGRVLFPAPAPGATHAFVLEPVVRPLALLVLVALVWSAIHYRLHRLLFAALTRRFPWLCLVVALAAAVASTCAEGHMGCSLGLPAARAELVEEIAELLAYLALAMVQAAILLAPRSGKRRAEAAPTPLLSGKS